MVNYCSNLDGFSWEIIMTWISVKDQKPPLGEDILVTNRKMWVATKFFLMGETRNC